jgi:hypothetical protein
MTRSVAALALCGALAFAAPAAPQGRPARDLAATLERVGARVIEWYARAQSIVSTEEVAIVPLRSDLSPAGLARRLRYELRVAWEPEAGAAAAFPEPSVVRQVLAVNGRPPRPGDEAGCMDPKPVSPEPLMMLLPSERNAFAFSFAGPARVNGREALRIDFKGVAPGRPEISWTDDCVSVSLPGRSRGRIWVDAATYDVLRVDEQLVGMFDFAVPREHQRRGASRSMVIERADSSIRYRRVAFDDPPETLMLPAEVETVTVIRGAGIQRTRISQRFSDYRRFLADVRVLP